MGGHVELEGGTQGGFRAPRHLRTFGPASEEPYRRRTSDYGRVAVSVAIVALTCLHEGDVSPTERDLFALFNGLQNDLRSLFVAVYRLGALWAVLLIVVAALVGRRWRLARDLAISGVAAWAVARMLGVLVVNNGSLGDGVRVLTRFNDSPSFPLVRLAVITAVIAAAAPYVTRPVRRVGVVVIVLLACAALYLGTGFPNAVFAATAVGWGVAAAVHLVFGSPGGRPTRAQVAAALDELGVEVHHLEIAPYVPVDGTVMYADDDHGRVHIRVLGRDEADAQFLSKLWRFAMYKDGGSAVHLTRLEVVEQEAFALLLGERSGARVPGMIAVGAAGAGTALVATRASEGARLVDADGAEVTDALLRELWQSVARLHAARVAHGRLNAHHIVRTGKGPEIVDFSTASFAATEGRRNADVAELLYSTAGLVGDERAVSCAIAELGREQVAAAMPFLQALALSRDLRPRLPQARKQVQNELRLLRASVSKATGVEEPELQQLYRVDTTNFLMAVGSLVAVFALLSQIGDPGEFWSTIESADWAWLLLALGLSLATNVAAAIAFMGTVPNPLPLWRTAELQLSMSFSNLAVPAVGGMAAQVRFLQKQGVDLESAVAAGFVLSTAANTVTYLGLFAVALALSPTTIHFAKIPASSVVSAILIALVVAVIAIAVVWFVPKIHTLVVPRVKRAAVTIWAAIRSPRRLAEMVVGNVLNGLLYALVLLACIEAFGGDIDFWTVLALNIFIGTIASLIPIPGGGTAVGSVGLSGALTAAGVPAEIAVAAVLANQLVCNFVPAIPGWVATKNLLNTDYL